MTKDLKGGILLLTIYEASAITAVCYLIAAAAKVSAPKTYTKYIPPACGLLGILCALLFTGFNPQYLGVNIYEGAAAGLAATGLKEVTKLKQRIEHEKENEK